MIEYIIGVLELLISDFSTKLLTTVQLLCIMNEYLFYFSNDKSALMLPEEKTMPAKREDVRITKTKAALSNAFFDMLEVMSLEDITVNELCERADVRRATFYKHFTDKNDFTIYLIKDIREKFDDEIWEKNENTIVTKEYYLSYAKALLKYLLGREKAISAIINSDMRPTFIELIVRQNYEDTKERLKKSKAEGMPLAYSPEAVASMMVGGIAYCITHWFEDKERCCSADTLLKDISNFIEKVLS